jgi:hypothetical protein
MSETPPTDPPPLDRRKTDAGADGAWLTIEEAAARLGLSKVAIRSKVKRGTLRSRPGTKENDGLTRVWVGGPVAPREGGSTTLDRSKTDPDQRPIPDTSSELVEARIALAAAYARIEAQDAELARLMETHAAELARLGADRARVEELLRLALAKPDRPPAIIDTVRAWLAARLAPP